MEELEALFTLVRDAKLVIIVTENGAKVALDYQLQSLLTQGLMFVKDNARTHSLP